MDSFDLGSFFENNFESLGYFEQSRVDPCQTPVATGSLLMKSPLFIIAALLVAAYVLVNQYSSSAFSAEPVVLNRADPPEILMFGTQSCRYCSIARAFFDTHKLPYVEQDIEVSDKHLQMFYLLGGTGTPLIIINGDVIHGFDEMAIRRAL